MVLSLEENCWYNEPNQKICEQVTYMGDCTYEHYTTLNGAPVSTEYEPGGCYCTYPAACGDGYEGGPAHDE